MSVPFTSSKKLIFSYIMPVMYSNIPRYVKVPVIQRRILIEKIKSGYFFK
jgi:hypothetical protein